MRRRETKHKSSNMSGRKGCREERSETDVKEELRVVNGGEEILKYLATKSYLEKENRDTEKWEKGL